MQRFIISILCIYVAVGLLVAPCQAPAQETPPGRWWRMPKVTEQLKLTTDEQRRLDDLFAQNRRTLIDQEAALEKERFELENLMDQEPLNETAVREQFKRMEQARGVMAHERFGFLVEVRKLLGYERYQKLRAMFQEYHEKRRHQMSRHEHDGDGKRSSPPCSPGDF